MFVRTYGQLYQQNAHIFNDLFTDLRSYYRGRNINLLDALENFFATLFQRMFQLLNAQYELDQSYLGCVANTMDKLNPFGDVPQKFSQQLKRSFVAARTFMQGLAIGRDVILQVGKIQPCHNCRKSLMKMMYCSYCSGLPTIKPCNNYCLNVMKGCLAYQAELNSEWNKYINELIKVANRLMTSFNIEQVVDPMDVKISEAIMNLQEGSEKIRQQVFTSCGQPRFKGRRKRKADYEEYAYGNWRYQPTGNGGMARPTTAAGTNLERLVSDIVKQVEVTKDFWTLLPYTLCNHDQFAFVARNGTEGNCWNGEHQGRYPHDVVQDGIKAQAHNPEVTVDTRRHNMIVQQQILRLKLIHTKLSNAHLGLDVDWMDMADTIDDTLVDVGSGSGSGSGAGIDDDENGSGYTFHEDSTTRRYNHHHHTNPPTSTSKMPPTPVENRPRGGATSKTGSVVILMLLTAVTAWIQSSL
ncbi:glypican-6-like [Lingula anatina]|uniref:Glypican-6-like n=1 Tax=Lingula anatina TaxID=7574 RepID=A0A2R2MTY5_LINAN|nr:glypican-6-like [Lingula anatina]|eukprot:XP_023933709.1 glypican-6-like [Lingula anatina]